MNELEIMTNHHWKEILYGHEVPQKVLDDYDWLEEEDKAYGWVKYRRTWYHLSDFMNLHNKVHNPHFDNNHPFAEWDGYHGDSFFSGVLIKFSDCGDSVKMATYFS